MRNADSQSNDPNGPMESALGRLREASAILEAIDTRGLLDELPASRQAQRAHQSAVSMLAVLRRELEGVAEELEAAILTRDVVGRATRPATTRDPKASPPST